MKTTLKFVAASMLLATTSHAVANDYKTTIEYRHEYRDGNNKHSDRVKAFIDTGKNIGFELDARYNNDEEDKMYDSMSINGSELSIFYYKKLKPNLTGVFGSSLDFNPDGNSYHSKIQQFDTWLGYKTGDWDFQYERW